MGNKFQSSMPRHMQTLRRLEAKMGTRYPEALFLEPVLASEEEQKAACEAMRVLGALWSEVCKSYKVGLLPQPGQGAPFKKHLSLASPDDEGFFTKKWMGREREYRHLIEPVDIASWYFKNKNVDSAIGPGSHYVDGIENELVDENHKRPGRYLFLQQQEARSFGSESVHSSLGKRRWFKEVLKDERWQDANSSTK